MKYTFLTLALILLVSIKFMSCKEKFECTADKTVAIPQVMKDYFYFKQGWWVYVNVKNNTYDSLWVSQSSSNNYRGEGREGFGSINNCYEQTNMGIDNKGTKGFMRWDVANVIKNDNQRFVFSAIWRDTSTTAEGNLNLFFINKQLEPFNSIRITSEFKDSAVVQSIKYKDLIEVKGSANIIYWLFGQKVGIIKYLDSDSNQWELIKYHVNQ